MNCDKMCVREDLILTIYFRGGLRGERKIKKWGIYMEQGRFAEEILL